MPNTSAIKNKNHQALQRAAPTPGVLLLRRRMSYAPDDEQDVFFYWPAKRCHCPIRINWTSAVVAHGGCCSVTANASAHYTRPSLLKASRPGRRHKGTPAGVSHCSPEAAASSIQGGRAPDGRSRTRRPSFLRVVPG